MRCEYCPRCDEAACPGESFRRLCGLVDPGNPAYDPGYRATILVHPVPQAHSPPTPDPAELAETIRLLKAVHACPYRSLDSACGCAGARCALKAHAPTSHTDCLDCMRRFG